MAAFQVFTCCLTTNKIVIKLLIAELTSRTDACVNCYCAFKKFDSL